MKMKFYFSVFLILYSFVTYSQKDSLVFKGKKFVSLYSNIFSQVNKIKNGQNPDLNATNSEFLLNFSFGNFKKNGVARILTFGLSKGGSEYERPKNIESSFGISFAYAKEKYKFIGRKIAIFGGISAGLSYKNQIKKGENIVDNSIYQNQINTAEIMLYSKAYPGITYFINSRWAITAIIGNLSLFDFSNKAVKSFENYGDNGNIFTAYNTDNEFSYSLSPSFSMNNSGIGLRYFLK